jgi:hypothetical protein
MCPPEGLEDTPLLQIKQIGQFWGKKCQDGSRRVENNS